MLLEELNLLESPKLVAISSFHPLEKKTHAKIISGGLFMSKRVLKEFSGDLVYYDKSRELKRLMDKVGLKKTIEIDTLGLESFETIDKLVELLKKNSIACEKRIQNLYKKINGIKQKVYTCNCFSV